MRLLNQINFIVLNNRISYTVFQLHSEDPLLPLGALFSPDKRSGLFFI